MNKKSKYLTLVFGLAVAASVAATFYRYIVVGDISYLTDENAFQESLLEE